jgi:IS5 family transposase
VLQAKALHANLFDGHTLGPVIAELEALTGIETRRIHVDKGYRGHNHAQKFRVWIIGQVRRITAPIAARCAAAPPSSLSLATSRPSTGWAAITTKVATATASTPCSPPPATTSVCSCAGSSGWRPPRTAFSDQ